ncbi:MULTISPECIES: SpoIIE family protein phosphatase [Bacillaceae]|uniref:SpoIIE family protein phosphatase n=1 Tax=Evansella alkalicola TaxID=745819 RepID=A0ABS6JZ06_9BACI|nr:MULTISPECIES: SpoIIE family protein phosphatase [Bacillaceae]MBU9723808.1 SpoIIE family protein phosphatase [Bacillus alkalicola]
MFEHQYLNGIKISAYKAAKKGNWCSGDSYFITRTDQYILCAVVDGLGSGEEAMEASTAVIDVIKTDHSRDVSELMEQCNRVLSQTRGAVLAILKINTDDKEVIYSNVGNIGCVFYCKSGQLNRPIPSRGYLSGRKLKIKVQRLPYEEEMAFVMYTDGFSFNPKFHSLFNGIDNPKDTMQQLVDEMEITNDDTTLLVGKIEV